MDFYETWLGIPADRRPPTYYDLLGLPPFADDMAAIEQAALRRMGKLRHHQIGQHSDQSQEILSELARARLVLMDPNRRAGYDAKLRERGDCLSGLGISMVNAGNGNGTGHSPSAVDAVPYPSAER